MSGDKLRMLLIIFSLIFQVAFAEDVQEVNLDSCGVKKYCLKQHSCKSWQNCDYAATWIQVDDNYLEVELVGHVESSSGYLAIAFSSDKSLGDDSVVGCYYDGGEVKVRASYNPMDFTRNVFVDNVQDDFIKPVWERYGIVQNQRLFCAFRRRLTPSSPNFRLFDLRAQTYHVMIMRGPSVDSEGLVSPYRDTLVSTPNKLKMDRKAPIFGTGLVKAHGCLMVLAYVLFASIGILMARYFKNMWPSYALRDERMWFHVHRVCQVLCWFFATLAFILIFISVNGYSSGLPWPQCLHPILGIIVFILTFINPFLTLCRCEPRHPDRPYFNWTHFLVGTFAYVLAVPTMMLGFRMESMGTHLATLNYPMIILIIFVIFQVVVELCLEIHDASYYQRNRESQMKYELQLEDYHMRLNQGVPQVPPKPPQPEGRQFKYFMGGLHTTVCIICSAALVIAIIVN